jgi:hypothetical protein
LELFGKALASCLSKPDCGENYLKEVSLGIMEIDPTAPLWIQGKWRDPEEKHIQLLDLALKILVPALLLVCLAISIKYGSFDGYLTLLSRQSFATPLMAVGASFTLAYLAFQVALPALCPAPRPPAQGHGHHPGL